MYIYWKYSFMKAKDSTTLQSYIQRCSIQILNNQRYFYLILGRVTMTMTTLLTLTAMFGSVRSSVPRVSYISLLDIWMFMCIVFVFIVIIHFVVVISLLRYGHKKAAEAVEIVGALLVPILFIMFNVFYWLNLLHHSGNNENLAKDVKFDWS